MRVCYFGTYKSDYSRNKLFIKGLRQNGIEVLECQSDKTGVYKYVDLIRKHKPIKNSYEVMIVGYPGFQSILLAKCLTKKPIIFNAFVSLYDSMVWDRKLVNPLSLKAWYYWVLDKYSLAVADIAIFDTKEHIKYVSKEFGIQMKKLRRILLGADSDIFYPREAKKENKYFNVVFCGHFIPLQGIEYIIQAAKILEKNKDIRFEIIGDGQEKENIIKLKNLLKLDNTFFVENLKLEDLAESIAKADVCLGIFGNTAKAKRVIPNKVYEYVAMRKPVITADTSAIRELFNDDEIFFVEISNSQAIAKAILVVKSDRQKAELFAERALSKFIKNALPENIGFELKNMIQELI